MKQFLPLDKLDAFNLTFSVLQAAKKIIIFTTLQQKSETIKHYKRNKLKQVL